MRCGHGAHVTLHHIFPHPPIGQALRHQQTGDSYPCKCLLATTDLATDSDLLARAERCPERVQAPSVTIDRELDTRCVYLRATSEFQ